MILEIFVALSVVLLTIVFNYRRKRLTRAFENSYVIITGCDSGFGRLAAERFHRLGMHVFAGCLLDKSVKELKESSTDRLVPFQLDIRKLSDIENLLQRIKRNIPDGQGLTGLINNAGISGSCGLIESLGSDQYLSTFRVNFFGMVDVTKTLMPLLRKGKGRIINTSSVGGKLAAPFTTPYLTTKYAIESYSDSLRRELYHDDISVHIIEPGMFKTGILNKGSLEVCSIKNFENLPSESKEFYGIDMITKTIKNIDTGIADADTNFGKVVDAYQHALTSPYPKIRYKVGIHSWILIPMANYLPEWLMDMIIGLQFPKPARTMEK
ncbi:hypothetical protein FSP39_010782 [Pinctada imbricata]|uniref:Uncharacterized protein n=1 Tax=Pinctada imbricata TaxID=66713 RepID=A0AA88Y024_PINIB|nr:hypothetical protein FSP39_010782 [Pinctada imbricata]